MKTVTAILTTVILTLCGLAGAQVESKPGASAPPSPSLGQFRHDNRGRVSEFINAQGKRHGLSYDGFGRLYAVTGIGTNTISILHYRDENSRQVDAVSAINTETGKQLGYVFLNRAQRKYYEEGEWPPEANEIISLVSTIEYVDEPIVWDNWGVVPKVPLCDVYICENDCDAMTTMGLAMCAGLAAGGAVPAALACTAVALNARNMCKQRCSARCN